MFRVQNLTPEQAALLSSWAYFFLIASWTGGFQQDVETQGILRVRDVVYVGQEKQPEIVLRIGLGYLKVRSAWLSSMIFQHVVVTKRHTRKTLTTGNGARWSVKRNREHFPCQRVIDEQKFQESAILA